MELFKNVNMNHRVRDIKNIHYLNNNEFYNALKKIILAKYFLKDLQHIKQFVHTGCL